MQMEPTCLIEPFRVSVFILPDFFCFSFCCCGILFSDLPHSIYFIIFANTRNICVCLFRNLSTKIIIIKKMSISWVCLCSVLGDEECSVRDRSVRDWRRKVPNTFHLNLLNEIRQSSYDRLIVWLFEEHFHFFLFWAYAMQKLFVTNAISTVG